MRITHVLLGTAVLLSASACGTADSAADAHTPGGLAAPERGFQLRAASVVVESGSELEYCEIVELPGEPSDTIWVKSMESAMSGGSHHLIVSAVEPGSAMDATLKVGDRLECPFGALSLGQDSEDIFGAQTPYR